MKPELVSSAVAPVNQKPPKKAVRRRQPPPPTTTARQQGRVEKRRKESLAAKATVNAPPPAANFFSGLTLRPANPGPPIPRRRRSSVSSVMTTDSGATEPSAEDAPVFSTVSDPISQPMRHREALAKPSRLGNKQAAITSMRHRLGMGIESALERSKQPRENVGTNRAELWVEKADTLRWPRSLLRALAHLLTYNITVDVMNGRLSQKVSARMVLEGLQGPEFTAVRTAEVKELSDELRNEGVALWEAPDVEEAVFDDADDEENW